MVYRRRDILGHDMTVIISMLRGVNVGGHNKIKMDALRALYGALKLRDAQTYVQSGNVIFRSEERDIARLAKRIEDGNEGGGCQEPVCEAARDRARQAAGEFSGERSGGGRPGKGSSDEVRAGRNADRRAGDLHLFSQWGGTLEATVGGAGQDGEDPGNG